MRRLLALLASIVMFIGTTSPSRAADEQIEISGTVTHGGAVVAGAALQLSGPGGSATSSTDGSGRFSFEIAPGSGYGLSVEWNSPPLSMTRSVRFGFSGIDLTEAREITVSLPQAKRITLRAVDQNGSGIAGATANLTGTNYGTWTLATATTGGASYASSAVNQSMGSSSGDESGYINLDIFEWRNEISIPVSVPSPAGGTLYGTAKLIPSQVSTAEAAFTLPASNPVVSGRVQFASGRGIPSLSLTGGGGGFSFATTTDDGGNFSFSVPEDQVFNVIASGSVSGYEMLDRLGFNIEGAQVTANENITITIPEPNLITARIQDQDGVGLEGVQLSGYGTNLGTTPQPSVSGLSGNLVVSNLGQSLGRTTTNSQGEVGLYFWSFPNNVQLNATFLSESGSSANGTLEFVPDGPKSVTLNLEIPKTADDSIQAGGGETADDSIQAGGGATDAASSNFSTITGLLVDSNGKAASGARITGGNGSTGYDTRTSTDGSFRFTVTKTGSYNMIVDWYDPPFSFTKRVGFSVEGLDFSVDRNLVLTVPAPERYSLKIFDKVGLPIKNALIRAETVTLGTYDFPSITGANTSASVKNINQSLSTARSNEVGEASLAFGSWRTSVQLQVEVTTCAGTKISETHTIDNTASSEGQVTLRGSFSSKDSCPDQEAVDAEKPISTILPKLYVTSSAEYAFVIGENVSGRRISIQTGGKWFVFQSESEKFTYYFPFPADSNTRLIKLWLDGSFLGEQLATRESTENPGSSDFPTSSPSVSYSVSSGELALKVENAAGLRISAKVNGKWHVATSLNTEWTRTWSLPAGTEKIDLAVYLNRVLVLSKSIPLSTDSSSEGPAAPQISSSSGNVELESSRSQSVELSTDENFVDFVIRDAEGKKISIKFGGRWFAFTPDSEFQTFRVTSSAGASVLIKVYVDGALAISKNLTIGSEAAPVAEEDEGYTPDIPDGDSSEQVYGDFSYEIYSVDGDVSLRFINSLGRKISVKFGGRWLTYNPTSNDFEAKISSLRGQSVKVDVYLDGERVGSSVQLVE